MVRNLNRFSGILDKILWVYSYLGFNIPSNGRY